MGHLLYERIYKYEAELAATVCLKIGFKNTRRIFLCAYHRQITINYSDPNMKLKSQSNYECNKRFEEQVLLWEKILEEKKNNELLICGDFNFCSIKQHQDEHLK